MAGRTISRILFLSSLFSFLLLFLPSPFPSISISLDRDETLVSQNIYQFETRILLTIDSIVATSLFVWIEKERKRENNDR